MLTLFLVMSVGVGVGTAQVVTEEPAVGTTKEVQEVSQNGQSKKVLVVSIQDIELTDEQEARIAAIRKEFRPKVQEAAKELNTLTEAEVDQICRKALRQLRHLTNVFRRFGTVMAMRLRALPVALLGVRTKAILGLKSNYNWLASFIFRCTKDSWRRLLSMNHYRANWPTC